MFLKDVFEGVDFERSEQMATKVCRQWPSSLQTGTLLRLADSDMEVKLKASIFRFTLSRFLFAKVISFSWYVMNRVNFQTSSFLSLSKPCVRK